MSEIPANIGRYDVERLLGEGGMGVLYLARDPVIDRHVALKVLRVDGEDLRRRLMREAQSAGRLQHPNIVTVYDVGDHDGQLYIAMEYIDGDTLATLIRDDVPFSTIRKLDIIDEIADGLGYAHQRGIIHRDIKPANLMISRAGLVKVLDFGIARLSHRESIDIDGATLIGTPAYMAPEHLEGAEVDARIDIYAVGLVMYELFSGHRAFVGANTAEVLQRVLAAQPTPLERLVPDIDPDLARVVAKAMVREPGARYQDLQALRKDLSRVRRRAMQAGADDATIVVSAPASITGALKAPTATQPAPVAPATAGGPAPDTQASRSRTQEDLALAHLAARQATRSKPSVAAQDTPAAADETVAVPRPAQASALPPPLPVVAAVPPADDGPMPVPLPAVPSSGAALVSGAGRSTVDAPVIAAPPERPAPAVPAAAAGHGEVSPRVASSSPRLAAPAAPPPVAARGAVQAPPAHATSPTPSARRGVSAAVIVAGMVALLALCFVVAFVAVRSFGLLSGPSLSGLFTRTVEPKVTGPAAVSTTTPPPTAPTATEVPVTVDEANDPQAGVAEPPAAVPAPVAPPVPTDVTPSPSPPPTATVAPRATRTPPVRDTPRESRTAQVPPETTRPVAPPVRETPREVAPPAAENPPPPRPVERREPDPPPVLAPTDDGLALVRAYVAARNTAHASGIRRVWPDVDDNHLRRITSAFSAPLTLAGCDIAAQDAAHATATCRLTQPGTTGAYASAQGLTIRRTFVFDLARQGRVWVIVGLRE